MTWAVLWYACQAVIIFNDFSFRSIRWIFIHVVDVKVTDAWTMCEVSRIQRLLCYFWLTARRLITCQGRYSEDLG